MELRRPVERGLPRVHDRRQDLVIDGDQVDRVGRDFHVFRNDYGDGITDMMDFVDCQYPRRVDVIFNSACLPRARQRVEIGEMLAREHAQYARHGERSGSIDRLDSSVRVRRSKRAAWPEAGQSNVVEIAGCSGYQARIFPSLDRLTEHALRRID